MINLLEELLIRQIPDHLRAGYDRGDYKLYGSVLKAVANGRFVGHLQETSGIGKVIGSALLSPVSAPLQAARLGVDVVGHAASFVQNEQIKAAVATVQNLQLAGLALGAAGIGVAVVGFAIMSHKIARVETKIDALTDTLTVLAGRVEALRHDHIAADIDRLRTAAQRMDEGWQLSAPEAQWRDVASEMHRLQNSFSRRAEELLARDGGADLAGAEPFLEALALASAVRVSARLAAGDEAVARQAAQEGVALLHHHGQRFRLADAAMLAVRAEKVAAATPAWGEAMTRATQALRPLVVGMRTREVAADATAITLDELDRQCISGRDWMAAARAETEVPFIFLPATDA